MRSVGGEEKGCIIRHMRRSESRETSIMKICLVGVSCAGKTTIGRRLAERLGYAFFDVDTAIEDYFGTSIERLKSALLTEYAFRQKAALVLNRLVSQQEKAQGVIALPPRGLTVLD